MNAEWIIQMISIRPLLYASLAFAMTAAAQAQPTPDVAGSWHLAIGNNTVCPLTLAADGTATHAADCAAGNRIARWDVAINKLELRTASGEMVGVLLPKGDSYAGKNFSDGRKLVLSR